MVVFENTYMNPEDHVCHVRCLSTDVKPYNVGQNSDLVEFNPDTGEIKLYFFVGDDWVEANV